MKKSVLGILAVTIGLSVWASTPNRFVRPNPANPMTHRPFGFTGVGFQNPGVVQIDQTENYSRVVAISDVHGMYQNLYRLLSSIHLIDQNLHWLGGNTLLIVVGDSIDKGPDSIDVLDLWMELIPQAQAAGGNIIHSLGDHEAQFLANPNNPDVSVFVNELRNKNIPLQEMLDPSFPRAAFLRSMPLAVRVGNWLFAHSGFYPQVSWSAFVNEAQTILQAGAYGNPFLSDPHSILNAVDWWKDADARTALEVVLSSNHFFGVVFGHEPTAFNVQNDVASADAMHLIKIDSGMAPDAGAHSGHLLVFTQPAQLETLSQPQAYSLDILENLRPLF